MSDRTNIELIKDRVDIVDLVSGYIKLRNNGKNFTGLCPFHTEKTPSFNVNPTMQIYKCFGCGKSGDIFSFVQEIEKIDFSETLEKLAKIAGVEIKEHKVNEKFAALQEINRHAAIHFYKMLKSAKGKQGLDYLTERGIKPEEIKSFGLGYAYGQNELTNQLMSYKKYTKYELLESGLVVENNGQLKDRFIQRVMFPIRSHQGHVIGFTGRATPQNDYGPKYLHTKETPLFHKSSTLYGVFEAKQSIREEDLCIVCEGTLDVISASAIGHKNIVAPLGTAFAGEQAELIKKYTRNVLFILDSDEAGQNALVKSVETAVKTGLLPFAASPTPYKDIDEVAQKEPDRVHSIISDKQDAFAYILNEKLKTLDISQVNNYKKMANFIHEFLDSIQDPEIKDFYRKKSELITGVVVTEETNNSGYLPPQQKQFKPEQEHLSIEEYYLFYLLHSEKFKHVKTIEVRYFMNKPVKSLLIKLQEKETVTEKEIKKLAKDPDYSTILTKLYLSPTITDANDIKDTDLDMSYNRVKKATIEKALRVYRVKLASAEQVDNKEMIDKYQEKIVNLTNILKTY